MAVHDIVIAGAGMAGAKTAEALRTQGFDGSITLIGEESHHPYERPPLSKEYLVGTAGRDSVFVHSPDWYTEHAVELWPGMTATAIDRAAQRLELADGSRLSYDKLLLSTGASPRSLPTADPAIPGVHYLRRLDDADRIKTLLHGDGNLVVVGAGWIGLEVAAAARQAGLRVTVAETNELPLLPVLGPDIARVFADLHAAHGVEMRFGVTLDDISTGPGGAVTGVRLSDGTRLDADAVLVGIGAAPTTRLADQAGLTVDNGVVVDAALRSSDPTILAAGDVANAFHPLLGRHIRVEHWANAGNQPATAAATLLDRESRYDALPYFFTDQYELGMEYCGHIGPGGYDRVVVRGDLTRREFIAFWLVDNRVVAGMNVNIWDVTDPIKTLIRSGKPVDPDTLADPATPLTELAGQ